MSDFTYVATWAGFVYVAFLIDTYARRIVGCLPRSGANAFPIERLINDDVGERRIRTVLLRQ